MMDSSIIKHLSKEDIVKNGSIFTPQSLVSIVYDLLSKYISDRSFIGDFGSGYGAFLEQFYNKGKKCFATEIDKNSFSLLKQLYPNLDIYNENSLVNVNRKKYGLADDDELIIIGNPPYNDITSQYHKGNKGNIICDEEFASRDLGISFLKAFNKLNPKYVCVLHPLAYLIKKTNFNSLGKFKENYKLLKGVIFSSSNFESIKKNSTEFPVVAALYERNSSGMNYEYIQKFTFDILKNSKKFVLTEINTIDKKVNKYPKKDSHNGLQFYTMRDINALLRNTTFIDGNVSNGVEVSIKTLYQYGWILFFKNNFKSNNMFLYGNLSPLYPKEISTDFKNASAYYAFNSCDLVKKYYSKDMMIKEYGQDKKLDLLDDVLEEMCIF